MFIRLSDDPNSEKACDRFLKFQRLQAHRLLGWLGRLGIPTTDRLSRRNAAAGFATFGWLSVIRHLFTAFHERNKNI